MKFRGILFSFFILSLADPSVLYAADIDGDGIQDQNDNCRGVPNPNQDDDNDDGIGDDCPESITGGLQYFCATLNGGKIKCWGDNDYGQLGNWSTVDMDLPTAIFFLTPFKIAWADGWTTCSAVENGNDDRAYCWGRDNSGGNNHHDSPHLVSSLHHVRTVKPANSRRCAIAEGSEVFCWGVNDYGQTGEDISGNFEENAFTSTPFHVPGINNAESIMVGDRHTCVVSNGLKVFCWGNNYGGNIGQGTNNTQHFPPTQVPGLSNVQYLTGGYLTTCAVMSNNSLKCWGRVPPDNNATSPTTIGVWNNAKKVLDDFGEGWCFVRRDGTAACTASTFSYMPDWDDIEDIALGGYGAACALRASGAVWCWGANFVGQLGRGYSSDDFDLPPAKVHF